MHSNYTDVKMHIPDKSTDSDDTSIEFVLKELSEYANATSRQEKKRFLPIAVIRIERDTRDRVKCKLIIYSCIYC